MRNEDFNMDIRLLAKSKRVAIWEIANHLCVSESTMYRMLRQNLNDKMRERIISAIDSILRGEAPNPIDPRYIPKERGKKYDDEVQ